MVCIDYHNKVINFKIVYYGPKNSGKTSHLEYLKKVIGCTTDVSVKDAEESSIIESISVSFGKIRDFNIVYHFQSISAEPCLENYRKASLVGADGILFIVDPTKGKENENLDSLKELTQFMKTLQISKEQIQIVILYNKRENSKFIELKNLEETMNIINTESLECNILKGDGVLASLKSLNTKIMTYTA